MKKVINRKVYDTEMSEEISSYSNDLGNRDFRNYCETLYKTKNGNYFLSGHGGHYQNIKKLIRWEDGIMELILYL